MKSSEEYARRAAELMNRRDHGVERYYRMDNTMVVYNPEKNEWAQGNEKGELETYFRPRRGRDFIRRWVEEDLMIRLK